MLSVLRSKAWSPYLAGAGIGVLSWFAFASADHPLGITTAVEHTAAIALQPAVGKNAYYATEQPVIGWEWMLVVGVLIGSLISATLSGDRSRLIVPPLWESRFGGSVGLRFAAAFLGGALMMFGARLAKGCTSGHGISGTLQLAVSSWVFIALVFATGILVAHLIYGRRERGHV